MVELNNRVRVALARVMAAGFFAVAGPAVAHANALHGFCWGAQTCSDNGTNTPTSVNPPQFGFYTSTPTFAGKLEIALLVPNDPLTSPLSVTRDQGGSVIKSFSTSLYTYTPWSKGSLGAYLFSGVPFTATPNNSIRAFTPTKNGYFVYTTLIGPYTLSKKSGKGPLFGLSGALPIDSYIVGFLLQDGSITGTANSGAIYETGTPTVPVPEPGSLLLLGTAVVGLGLLARRRR